MTFHLIWDNACFISHNSHKCLALIKDNCEILCFTRSSLIHFACIGVAPTQIVTPCDMSRGSNCYAGKMDQACSIFRPTSVVHIGNRLKIGHCFMMSCKPNVLPRQLLLKI